MVGRALVGVLLSAIFLPVRASPGACGVIATDVDETRVYPSVVDAVESMQRLFLDESIRLDREYVGAIVERDGGYRASIGRGCANRDAVTFAVVIPAGARVAAFWHTHGAPSNVRELFSPEDVSVVRATQCDFYLITPRGEVRVLRVDDVARGVTMVRSRIGTGTPMGSARGIRVPPSPRPDERVVHNRAPLPSESRGAVPIG
jgi:hypothetical protein